MTILDVTHIATPSHLKTINLAKTSDFTEIFISDPSKAGKFGFAGGLGYVRLDVTHPTAARYIAAGERSNQISMRVNNLFTAFERAPGIFSGLWAALKLKLVERKLLAQDMQALEERRACADEFLHLFEPHKIH